MRKLAGENIGVTRRVPAGGGGGFICCGKPEMSARARINFSLPPTEQQASQDTLSPTTARGPKRPQKVTQLQGTSTAEGLVRHRHRDRQQQQQSQPGPHLSSILKMSSISSFSSLSSRPISKVIWSSRSTRSSSGGTAGWSAKPLLRTANRVSIVYCTRLSICPS